MVVRRHPGPPAEEAVEKALRRSLEAAQGSALYRIYEAINAPAREGREHDRRDLKNGRLVQTRGPNPDAPRPRRPPSHPLLDTPSPRVVPVPLTDLQAAVEEALVALRRADPATIARVRPPAAPYAIEIAAVAMRTVDVFALSARSAKERATYAAQ